MHGGVGGSCTCVDNAAAPVHVIEAKEDLFGYLANHGHGDTFVLMPLDETKQILAKDLKDHANVSSIRAFVAEVIQERDDMRSPRVCLRWGGRRVGIGWSRCDGRSRRGD